MRRFVLPKIIVIVGLCLAIVMPGAAPALAAAPSNDDIDHALVIPALPYTDTQDLSQATVAPDDGSGCPSYQPSVWYSFTPTETMTIDATVDGTFSYVSIHVGTRGALTQLGCVNSARHLTQEVAAGQTYFLAVTSDRPTRFSIDRIPPPPTNDDFDHATAIAALPYSTTQPIYTATVAPDDPSTCRENARSLWYTFTADETMYVDVGLNNQTALLSVYIGARGALAQVECYTFPPRFRMQLVAEQTYFFMAEDASPTSVTFSLARSVLPPNDDFDSALTIPSLPFGSGLDFGLAFSSPDDPPCMIKTLWYKFTPTRNMWVKGEVYGRFNTVGKWGVYTGTRSNLSEVICGRAAAPDSVIQLRANTTYYFMFGLIYPQNMNYTYQSIQIEEVPPPVTIDATVDPKATVDPDTGAVKLQGTFACSRATVGGVMLQLDQAFGHTQASGSTIVSLGCDGVAPKAWSATIPAASGVFNPGPLNATLRFSAYDDVRRRSTTATIAEKIFVHAAPSK